MTVLVLDLKTVPDPEVGKRLLALEKFSDAEAVLAMKTLRVAGHQSNAVPAQQRRVVAAALVIASESEFTVQAFTAGADEAAMLAAIEQLVRAAKASVWAWDGARSYRTQLLARALASKLALPALLAAQGPQSLAAHFGFALENASLSELAAVHGLPHRLGLRTADTEAAQARGDHQKLLAGSAVDALIAYLLSIALKAATGEINEAARLAAREQVCGWLKAQTASHWQQFHQVWKAL